MKDGQDLYLYINRWSPTGIAELLTEYGRTTKLVTKSESGSSMAIEITTLWRCPSRKPIPLTSKRTSQLRISRIGSSIFNAITTKVS